ncbi:MAG: FtsK/SpoIIIE domain-containing protein [Actinomycetota bacterium]|nr:FtsK/SpoIIIE domain-containing protein [Actinomycetota bacterium]
MIDGRLVGPEVGLAESGLVHGAVVGLHGGIDEAPPHPAAVELRVLSGIDAGRREPLPPGHFVIGRHPRADVVLADRSISRRGHCRITVSSLGDCGVADLGSTNGTAVGKTPISGTTSLGPGETLWMGSVACAVGPPSAEDRQPGIDPLRHGRQTGTIPFNRPPRAAPPPPLEGELSAPGLPEARTTPPFNAVALIAPLVLGLVMVVALRSVTYALFMLLSPVMVLGNWIDGRFRARRERRTRSQAYDRDLESFRTAVDAARHAECDRLRQLVPDPGEVVRRALTPSARVWERRPGDADFLLLGVGVGDLPWRAPLRRGLHAPPGEVVELIQSRSALLDVPIAVSLSEGGVVGVVGNRPDALAVARSLVCQALVHHGPADLPVVALLSAGALRDWEWLKWTPHLRDSERVGAHLVGTDAEGSRALLEELLAEARPRAAGAARTRPGPAVPSAGSAGGGSERPVRLVLVDDESLVAGRASLARSMLRGAAGPVAGIVLAGDERHLPAMCTTVLRIGDEGRDTEVHHPAQRQALKEVSAAGLTEALARQVARSLARLEDPEVPAADAGLPPAVALLPLLGMGRPSSDEVLRRWDAGGARPRPATPLGVGEGGPFEVDLGLDGPHVLVAGTTGSGKSELLRSMVVGLASSVSPEQLTFVLVDFKGGSAFEACSRLPHTVGFVTDLDEQLGERALRCLEAELRHRERVLRAAQASDLSDYASRAFHHHQQHTTSAGAGMAPLPRLVVVIDEFATLAAELPDFLDALVDVAQRGRSLGVHLVLATQRPSGAVSPSIKANTNARVSLRVQDATDSVDVIGVPDAAAISRGLPGRALVRLGAGEVLAVQAALVTGDSTEEERPAVEIEPFELHGRDLCPPATDVVTAEDSRISDLTRLVDAVRRAAAHRHLAPQRRPWPDPLAPLIDLAELTGLRRQGRPAVVRFAMADDPDAQTQYPTGWDLGGNLALFGIPGSGTTSALAAIALAAASSTTPDACHVHVLDLGAGDLGPLVGLPHVGSVVTASQRERQIRLVRHLRAELNRRRCLPPEQREAEPVVLLLVDGVAAFLAELDEASGLGVHEDFTRVWAEGPGVGINTAVSADRIGALPHQLMSLVEQRWVFRLADPAEGAAFGLRPHEIPRPTAGRAVLAGTRQVVQVGWRGPDIDAAVAVAAASVAAPTRPPASVSCLPREVTVDEVATATRLDSRPWILGLGVADSTLAPAGLALHDGEHAMLAGPPRSGRSNALLVLAAAARSGRDVRVCGVALGRSPLRGSAHVDDTFCDAASLAMLADVVEASEQPHLVLVDDADRIDDDSGVLARLLRMRRADLHLVVAGRNDVLRSAYGHWTREVRRSRAGLLFQPDPDLDGELFGTRLPRRQALAFEPGRAYLVHDGEVDVVQVAQAGSGNQSA